MPIPSPRAPVLLRPIWQHVGTMTCRLTSSYNQGGEGPTRSVRTTNTVRYTPYPTTIAQSGRRRSPTPPVHVTPAHIGNAPSDIFESTLSDSSDSVSMLNGPLVSNDIADLDALSDLTESPDIEEVAEKIRRPAGQNGHPRSGFSLKTAVAPYIDDDEYNAIQVRPCK